MGKYFGTDGFRGEANVDLNVEHAFKVGRFLGYYFGKDLEMQIEREEKGVCISFFFPYETSRRPTVSL